MFKDQEINCGECGTRFGFTAEEQSFYADKGLDHPPRRCKPCRLARKQQRGAGRSGPNAARGPRDRPRSAQPAEGPFVRRSRQNSHGERDNLPWQRGGNDRKAAGVWQPRHGKGPWASNGWQAPPRHGAPQDNPGRGNARNQRGPDRHGREAGRPAWRRDDGREQASGNRRREPVNGNRRYEPVGGNRGQRDAAPSSGRQDRSKPLVLHDAVCSDCSTATQVPFKPNNVMPVYCRTCLPKHKPRNAPPRGPSAGRA